VIAYVLPSSTQYSCNSLFPCAKCRPISALLDPNNKCPPEQNRLAACQKFFTSKKNPCGVPSIPPHGFVFLSERAVAFGESTERRPGTYAAERMPLSLESDESESLQILFADISAVQAKGNYVSLRHRPNRYLVHESLSSIAEKLKPYGFIRIHRSVVVNISAVEEVQPLPTGEYRLRVKGGKEYLVTRTYKHNLRDLAQLWVGSERFRG
jgi:hypothetical protein